MNDVAEAAGVDQAGALPALQLQTRALIELLADIGQELRERISKATVDAAGPRHQIENGFRAYFCLVETTPIRSACCSARGQGSPRCAGFRGRRGLIADAIAELDRRSTGNLPPNARCWPDSIVGMTESRIQATGLHTTATPDVDTLGDAAVASLRLVGLRNIGAAD